MILNRQMRLDLTAVRGPWRPFAKQIFRGTNYHEGQVEHELHQDSGYYQQVNAGLSHTIIKERVKAATILGIHNDMLSLTAFGKMMIRTT